GLRPGATSADGQIGKLTTNNLTIGGGELRYDVASGNQSDTIVAGGAGHFTRPSAITGTSLVKGTYKFLSSTNAIDYGPGNSFAPSTPASGVNSRTQYTPSFGANLITLTISGSPPKSLTWTGANGNVWDLGDINNTGIGTYNWIDTGSNSERFFN